MTAHPPKRRRRIISPQQLVPGVEIHGYRIVRKIAAGGTAWVFEVLHIESKRRLAMKVLNDQYRSDARVAKRFANEARAAMLLTSPHIVSIEDVGTLSQRLPYLVMEYLDGQDLFHVLEAAGWRLPVEKALNIVDQVAQALEIAHDAGVIHRDIKPENIYLLDTPNAPFVKVLDFGLSRVPRAGSFSALTRTGTTVGTPHYMALEQLRGDRTLDARADIYSLGVLTYELLSGHCPFEGSDVLDVMKRAARETPLPLSAHRPDLPPGLLKAVDHAMERDRDRRCPSAQIFRESIRPFWQGKSPHDNSSSSETQKQQAAIGVASAARTTRKTSDPIQSPKAALACQKPPRVKKSAKATPKRINPSSFQQSQSPLSATTTAPRRSLSTNRLPAATIVAIVLALAVLAIGVTCFVVDSIRGVPKPLEASLVFPTR